MQFKCESGSDAVYERFHSVLSLLSYLMKAPLVPAGTPVVNALGAQRQVRHNNVYHSFRAPITNPVAVTSFYHPPEWMTFYLLRDHLIKYCSS